MIRNQKWLWKTRKKVLRKREKKSGSFELSFDYALQLFEKGDYLGAISYFNTAESNQKKDNDLILNEWKEKAIECHELAREALKAEKEANYLIGNPDSTNSRLLKKFYQIAFFNYCRIKTLNPKHPKIRQKVWRMRFKSR